MSNTRDSAFRNIAIILAIIVACTVLPQTVRNFVSRSFEEFKAPIETLPSHISDLIKYWGLHSQSKRSLIEAGRDLARLNSAYETKIAENQSLRNLIKRYDIIMRMPSYDNYRSEIARVVRHDLNAWWQQITIRKGSLHGIREGCAVIYSGGVVGRIKSVGLYTSVVELVSSRNFRMAANIDDDERPVIYQGAGSLSFRDAVGTVIDVPSDIKTSYMNPVKIYTSSIAGTFPEGVLIGEIVNLKIGHDGIYQNGDVRLNGSLANLREVLVLIPIDPHGGPY